MKRKIIPTLLALYTIASLCACSDAPSTDSDGKLSAPINIQAEKIDLNPVVENSEVVDGSATEYSEAVESSDVVEGADTTEDSTLSEITDTTTEAPTDSETPAELGNPDEASSPTSDNFSLGTSAGRTYENPFLGIGCTLEDTWTFMSQDELAENQKLGSELINNEDMRKALDNGSILTAMVAKSPEKSGSISVIFQKIPDQLKDKTEEGFIHESLNPLTSTMELGGYSDVNLEKVSVNFAGRTRFALAGKYSINGQKFNQTQIPITKGDYLAVITISIGSAHDTETYINSFYALNR